MNLIQRLVLILCFIHFVPGSLWGAITLQLDQNEVDLSANAGTTKTVSDSDTHLTATGSGSANISISAGTSSGGQWLSASANSRTITAGGSTFPCSPPLCVTITVNANPAGLHASQNPYKGTVTISGGGSSVTITVLFSVNGVDISAALRAPFAAVIAGQQSPNNAITVTVANNGRTTVQIAVNTDDGGNWLVVNNNQATAQAPASIPVMIDATSLKAGANHSGNVTFSCNSGSPCLPATVNISVSITAQPVTATPSSLSFSTSSASTLQPQTVSLASAGSPVSFTLSQSQASMPWLSFTVSSMTTPATLTVSVSGATLRQQAVYSGNILIMPSNGGTVVSIAVSFDFTPPVTLSIDTTPISFTGAAGGSGCGQKALTIQSSSASISLAFVAAAAVSTPAGGSWLAVNPTSGNTPATLNVTCSAAGLASGNYSGSISVNVPNSSNPTLTIPVSLTVSNITLSQSSLTFDFDKSTGTSASTLSQTVTLTSPSPIGFTVAVSSGQNFITVAPTAGTTNTSLKITVDPSPLAASATPYQGTVTITFSGVTIPLSIKFQVSASQAALTLVAPLYLDGGPFQTSYFLLNPGSSTANFTISPIPAFDSPSVTGSISSKALATFQTPGTAGQLSAGWAKMMLDSGVTGFGVTQAAAGNPQQESIIPLMSASAAHFLVPFDNTNGFDTMVNLVNTSASSSANCTVNSGAQVAVAPGGNSLVDLAQLSALQNVQGVAEFVCAQPVFAATLRFNPSGAVAVHDVVTLGSVDRSRVTTVIPAALDGSSYQMTFALVNSDTVSQNYSFQFWNNRNGGAIASPLAGQTTGVISPGGVVFLTTDGSGSASSQLSQISFNLPFAELTAARTVSAFVFYEQGIDGSTIGAESAVPLTQTAGRHWTIPLSGTGGYSTALNIVNSNNNQAANVTLTYFGADGTQTGAETVSVPAGGSTLLQMASDPVAAGMDGILDLVSDQDLNGLVFRIAADNVFAAFSPLPSP